MPALIQTCQQLLDYLDQHQNRDTPQQRLGELLIARGHINAEQLDELLTEQAKLPEHIKLGQLMIQRGLLDRLQLIKLLFEQLEIARIDLSQYPIDEHALALIPEELARSQQIMPIWSDAERLVVASPMPSNHELLHLLGFVAGRSVEAVLARSEEIERAICEHYGSRYSQNLPEFETPEPELSLQRIKQLAEDKPTVRFVDSLLNDAIARRASDIHIRPGAKTSSVLLRIDGVLEEVHQIKTTTLPAIISRIKIIGGMNIAERRLPQDGRHLVKLAGRAVDLRLSIMPTVHGESVVIRVLDTEQGLLSLEQLGFSEADALRFRHLSNLNQGILLVTGPTGSGKSTTLYAALNDLKERGINIITVEDPVEYQIDGIRQIQVKPQIGYTFARALRHILRHDPDVIMVGEIRDPETALMACESALTGHLVLSTLHTNSAATTITRLLEIGIAPYLLNASLIGVLAQRLARRNCPHCLSEEPVSPEVRRSLGVSFEEPFYKGTGCNQCRGKGLKGRVAVYELLQVTPTLRNLIQADSSAQCIEQQAIADGMTPLTQNALALARNKLIPLSEVYRVRLE